MASKSSSEDDPRAPKSNEFNNIFRNDGSFLEMFKKMQEASRANVEVSKPDASAAVAEPTVEQPSLSAMKTVPIIGRRRGAKVLPVGKVKKLKTDEDDDSDKKSNTDAWSKYLEEVKKYKETYCESETKNRSLVK